MKDPFFLLVQPFVLAAWRVALGVMQMAWALAILISLPVYYVLLAIAVLAGRDRMSRLDRHWLSRAIGRFYGP